ncbi:MAG: phosphate propanoyltransferase [Oscillospiraceae bacterium]|jgi:putative phosphotransacetylase|nr:phosphate propanoyltransferase [Oscillospiraceae bacterium]
MQHVVPIEVSARHVHLSQENFSILFGNSEKLSVQRSLLLPGMFCALQRVTIVGPEGRVADVAIVGPMRSKTQIEISATDARNLGLNPPVRESGQLENSEKCKIIGPRGCVYLKNGVIIAKRHLHLSVDDAQEMDVADGEKVCVKIKTKERSLIFCDVVVRVSVNFVKVMHIDTDEANAAGCGLNIFGEIIKEESMSK